MNRVKKKVLITGSAGFLGYHLADFLSAQGCADLTLVDNLSRGKMDAELKMILRRPGVRFIHSDLTDKSCYKKLESHDEIYHFAAMIGVRNVLEHPAEVVRVNALSTLFLLDWFAKGESKKILFASTSEAYAWTQQFHTLPIPTPESVPLALTQLDNPRSSYAGSKIFGELAVTQYGRVHRKPFVIIRYHNVYGPRMGMSHVIPELFAKARKGQNPLLVRSADHCRAFCYVSDAIRATVLAMRSKAVENQTLNIGNDLEEISIGDLAKILLKKAGFKARIRPQPALHDPIMRRCPDISQARRVLRYEPQVMLEEGLKRTLAWYEKN